MWLGFLTGINITRYDVKWIVFVHLYSITYVALSMKETEMRNYQVCSNNSKQISLPVLAVQSNRFQSKFLL